MPSWVFGYDHAGFELGHHLAGVLTEWGDSVLLYGPKTNAVAADYVPYCIAAAEHVAHGHADYGIVIGGSGQGEQMAANKVRGIRAALVCDLNFALMARRDNDANVLGLPARIIAKELAEQIVSVWRETQFEGGRHARRLADITKYERGDLVLNLDELKGKDQS